MSTSTMIRGPEWYARTVSIWRMEGEWVIALFHFINILYHRSWGGRREGRGGGVVVIDLELGVSLARDGIVWRV